MLHHQRHHHHRQRACSAGNHARPAAESGGDETHDEGGVEAGEWVDLRHEGEGDSFRHQRQGYGQAAQGAEFEAGKGVIRAAVWGHATSNGNIHLQEAGMVKQAFGVHARSVEAG